MIRDVSADDRDRSSLTIVDLAEWPSAGERIILNNLIRCSDAEHSDVAKCLAAGDDVGDWSRPAGLHADCDSARDCRHHCVGIRLCDARALLNSHELLVVEESELNRRAANLECVLPD